MRADLTGLVLVDRYRLDRRLARGGMADVYRATDLRLERQVAIKILHPHLADDATFVERLKREAQAIATLAHPNVVAVYDQGEEGGRIFLVMELVEGEELGVLLGRQGALPISRAVEITRDVLAALEHAHARGVVHRDVKPQNVLLTSEGRAKLADFGIAQAKATATFTAPGEVLGSIPYLAPERLSGEPALPGADIYSVGVMLYQMLTGQLPFEGDSPAAIAAQHQQRAPDPPSARRPELPAWADEVVARALAKDPARRYASAAAMRDDLARRVDVHSASTEAFRVEMLSAASPPTLSPPRVSPPLLAKAPLDGRPGPFRRAGLFGAALGAVVLLSLLTFLVGRAMSSPSASITAVSGAPTSQATSAAASAGASAPAAAVKPSPTPSATAAPPTRAAAPPTAAPTASVPQRLAALKALVEERMPRGEAGKHEREIIKRLEEVERKVAKGDMKEAADEVRSVARKVLEMASEGKIDRDLFAQLTTQLTDLAARVR